MRLPLVLVLCQIVAIAGCFSIPPTEILATNRGGSQFEPAEIRVPPGKPIVFKVILDGSSHTVDFAEGNSLKEGVSESHSGNLDPGQTFEVTFARPGLYPYFCAYHSSLGSDGERTGMVGTVSVQ